MKFIHKAKGVYKRWIWIEYNIHWWYMLSMNMIRSHRITKTSLKEITNSCLHSGFRHRTLLHTSSLYARHFVTSRQVQPHANKINLPQPQTALHLVVSGKDKGKDLCTWYSASYMRRLVEQQRLTILKVAADWHELMVPAAWYAARQTYHHPNQPH